MPESQDYLESLDQWVKSSNPPSLVFQVVKVKRVTKVIRVHLD
jgi:hypothetical protein